MSTVAPPRIGWRTWFLRQSLYGLLRVYRFSDRMLGGAPKSLEEVGADADHGPILDRSDAPLLFKLLEHLDHRMGGVRPQEVRLGILPFCGVLALSGSKGAPRQVLIVGLPCFQIWSVDELSAMIAHELAHLKLEDAVFTREVVDAAGRLRTASGSRRILVRLFGAGAARLAADVCRKLEFRADYWSAACFRPDVLALALEKLLVVQPVFQQLLLQHDPLAAPDDNVFDRFDRLWNDQILPTRLADLRDKFLAGATPDPLDPHPSLADRLRRLAAARKADGAFQAPSASAEKLLRDPGELKLVLHNLVYRSGKNRARTDSVFFANDEAGD